MSILVGLIVAGLLFLAVPAAMAATEAALDFFPAPPEIRLADTSAVVDLEQIAARHAASPRGRFKFDRATRSPVPIEAEDLPRSPGTDGAPSTTR